MSIGANGTKNYAVDPIKVLDWLYGKTKATRRAAAALAPKEQA